MHVPTVLWACKTTYKKLTSQMPFQLVYDVEVVIPMEYIMHSLCITAFIVMEDPVPLEEWLVQLIELKEDRFLARFH